MRAYSYSMNLSLIYLSIIVKFYWFGWFCSLSWLKYRISSRYYFISQITLGMNGGFTYFLYIFFQLMSAKNLCYLISFIPLKPNLSLRFFVSRPLIKSTIWADQPKGSSSRVNFTFFSRSSSLTSVLFLPSYGRLPLASSYRMTPRA